MTLIFIETSIMNLRTKLIISKIKMQTKTRTVFINNKDLVISQATFNLLPLEQRSSTFSPAFKSERFSAYRLTFNTWSLSSVLSPMIVVFTLKTSYPSRYSSCRIFTLTDHMSRSIFNFLSRQTTESFSVYFASCQSQR